MLIASWNLSCNLSSWIGCKSLYEKDFVSGVIRSYSDCILNKYSKISTDFKLLVKAGNISIFHFSFVFKILRTGFSFYSITYFCTLTKNFSNSLKMLFNIDILRTFAVSGNLWSNCFQICFRYVERELSAHNESILTHSCLSDHQDAGI